MPRALAAIYEWINELWSASKVGVVEGEGETMQILSRSRSGRWLRALFMLGVGLQKSSGWVISQHISFRTIGEARGNS